MKTIQELRAIVDAAQPHDGDNVGVALKRMADANMTLLHEMLERIAALDERLEADRAR